MAVSPLTLRKRSMIDPLVPNTSSDLAHLSFHSTIYKHALLHAFTTPSALPLSSSSSPALIVLIDPSEISAELQSSACERWSFREDSDYFNMYVWLDVEIQKSTAKIQNWPNRYVLPFSPLSLCLIVSSFFGSLDSCEELNVRYQMISTTDKKILVGGISLVLILVNEVSVPLSLLVCVVCLLQLKTKSNNNNNKNQTNRHANYSVDWQNTRQCPLLW